MLSENRIFRQVYRQASKGMQKYGTLPVPDDYSALGWIQHRLEEATDQLVYTVALEKVLENVVDDLTTAKTHLSMGDDERVASVLDMVIERLGGCSNEDHAPNRKGVKV